MHTLRCLTGLLAALTSLSFGWAGESLPVPAADKALKLKGSSYIEFKSLFDPEEGRRGVVVTLLAVLELVKESLLDLVQSSPFGPIHVRAQGG